MADGRSEGFCGLESRSAGDGRWCGGGPRPQLQLQPESGPQPRPSSGSSSTLSVGLSPSFLSPNGVLFLEHMQRRVPVGTLASPEENL